jgi:hypothetical protein
MAQIVRRFVVAGALGLSGLLIGGTAWAAGSSPASPSATGSKSGSSSSSTWNHDDCSSSSRSTAT